MHSVSQKEFTPGFFADFAEMALNFMLKFYTFIQCFYIRLHAKQNLIHLLAKFRSCMSNCC